MKLNMTSHDVKGMVGDLNKMIKSGRVLNIYDTPSSSKQFIIKLQVDKVKYYLVLDSGNKFYVQSKPFSSDRKIPSSFVAKLRIHIKNKRIEEIRQLNFDRIVVFTFGTEENTFHLIVELYASGNIILTDQEYKILTLKKTHVYEGYDKIENNIINIDNKDDPSNTRFVVKTNNTYSFDHATKKLQVVSREDMLKWYVQKKDKSPKLKCKLRQYLSSSPLGQWGPAMIEHSMLKVGVDPKQKVNATFHTNNVFESIDWNKVLDELVFLHNAELNKGYIIRDSQMNKIVSYAPYPYLQNLDPKYSVEEVETFNASMDALYSSIMDKKETKVLEEKKETKIKVDNRDERILMSITASLDQMNDKIDLLKSKARFITMNGNLINIIIGIASEYFRAGHCVETSIMSDINSELMNRRIDHPMVCEKIDMKNRIIHLEVNEMNLEISFDDQFNTHFKNAEIVYEMIKKLSQKREKTKTALAEAEKKIELKKRIRDKGNGGEVLEPHLIQNIRNDQLRRKKNWFEAYHWFYSSEGVLVIGGKTADQNEEIVKKHLTSSDLYVHSSISGSPSCVIKLSDVKAFDSDKSLPFRTLEQAGAFVIHWTRAWKSGVPDTPYWVYPNQVSKTAESGEYLTKGSFMIRGKKNYLPKPRMEMGIGLAFKVNDSFCSDIQSIKEDEEIKHCVVMSGPYSLFNSSFTYKIKLIPGTTKTGKACKTIISNLASEIIKNKKIGARLKILVKAIPNDEYQKVMPNGVKVVLGLHNPLNKRISKPKKSKNKKRR